MSPAHKRANLYVDIAIWVLQHLPSLFLVAAVAGSFLLGTALSTVPSVVFGTYFAWVYLRFLQYKVELSARWDHKQPPFKTTAMPLACTILLQQ